MPTATDNRLYVACAPALSSLPMPIQVLNAPVTVEELKRLAADQFGDFVKAVVDVGRSVMAIGGELHADEEAVLLQQGARQADLWGINLYPDRPGVEDPAVQRQIRAIVERLVAR
jgi:Protein of unknown function (DUF5674)